MSFDNFLLHKGTSIYECTRDEAYTYIQNNGEQTILLDWLWPSTERIAFWKAMYWSQITNNRDNTLHCRCSAMRKAKLHWSIFKKNVVPIKKPMPKVPPLPE